MKHTLTMIPCAAAIFLATATAGYAADQTQVETRTRDQMRQQSETQVQTRDRERIYGSQMMTPEERTEYRAKMRSMKTQQERDAFRREHHQRMLERAKERGMDMPAMPPDHGGGMGPGGGGGRKR